MVLFWDQYNRSSSVIHFISHCPSKQLSDHKKRLPEELSRMSVINRLKEAGYKFDFSFVTAIDLEEDWVIKQSLQNRPIAVVVYSKSPPLKLQEECNKRKINLILITGEEDSEKVAFNELTKILKKWF